MSKFTSAIGSIFKAPKIDTPGTGPMPDPGSFASKLKARRENKKKKETGGGRDSTIKSQNYSGSNLAGTA